MLHLIREHQFDNPIFRSLATIWGHNQEPVPIHNNVLGVLQKPEGKFLYLAKNIVTNCGDLWYAERVAGETVTNSFAFHYMCTSDLAAPSKTSTTSEVVITTSSGKPHQVTERNNSDGDNTGGGIDIFTLVASYAKADFTQVGSRITSGIIANSGGADGTVLLTHYTFTTSFDKSVDDTLKVFVNHTFNGV